jgi:hypothetical protein
MEFKYWLLLEAGHFILKEPANLTVSYHSQPVIFKDVAQIDPRFELMNLPMPDSAELDSHIKVNPKHKFQGHSTFSLPLLNKEGKKVSQWIVVPRKEGTMFGSTEKAFISLEPVGVKIPLDWANYALIMNNHGLATYGGYKAMPTTVPIKRFGRS